jgi:uncharacterized protein involved in exopolysaccharide biosynthesis
MDLKKVLRLVYRKKGIFFLTVALITSLIAIGGYLLPKTYEAKSIVYIERNVLNELIKTVTVTSTFEEKVKAFSMVMKSRNMILKVMNELDLDIASKNAEHIEGLIRSFQEKTVITSEVNKITRKDMDLFTISYTDSDPKLATNFVNTLVRRYIEENLSLKREEAYGASRFLLDQISAYKVKLDRIETAIIKQRKDKNVSERSLAFYEQLQALQKKKSDLLVLYTESHPDVAKLKAEIEMMEHQIRTTTSGPGPDAALLDLERERETTKKIYEDLLATLRKSEVSTQLEIQDKAASFRVLDPAIEPTTPLSPNMITMLMIALAAGLGSGAGMLILADKADNSVKSVETVKKMGLPVLAVISTMRTAAESAAIKRRDTLVYTLAGLYLVLLLAVATMEAMGLSTVDQFIQGARTEIFKSVKKIGHSS